MQKQHQLLHTQEKILRYELAQKRKLLGELKEELEYSREKWAQAREKNSCTERQWKELRTEFASRRKAPFNDDINNSVESGYSDDRECSSDEEPGYETDVSECAQKNLEDDVCDNAENSGDNPDVIPGSNQEPIDRVLEGAFAGTICDASEITSPEQSDGQELVLLDTSAHNSSYSHHNPEEVVWNTSIFYVIDCLLVSDKYITITRDSATDRSIRSACKERRTTEETRRPGRRTSRTGFQYRQQKCCNIE